MATERFVWATINETTGLLQFVRLMNLRFNRWADLLSRIQRRHFRLVTATTTLTENDDIVQCDSSSGSITVNLPLANSVPGKRYDVKKMVAANAVILDAAGSDTIDGAGTFSFTTQYQSMTVECVIVTAPATYGWVIV